MGSFHYIEEGELLRLTGEYTTHKMYGNQLEVSESLSMRTGGSDIN